MPDYLQGLSLEQLISLGLIDPNAINNTATQTLAAPAGWEQYLGRDSKSLFAPSISPTLKGDVNGGVGLGSVFSTGNPLFDTAIGALTGNPIQALKGFYDVVTPEGKTEAQRYAERAEAMAAWERQNPNMPDGSSRTREAVAAPSAPGYVQDEQGYYRNTNDPNDQGYYVISGNTPVQVTAPLVPVPKPTAAGGGGGSSSSGGGGEAGGSIDGGFEDPNQIDPDLAGGGDLGGIGDVGSTGPTPMDKPPTEYTDDQWSTIIRDWLIRFPNASDADKETAITQYGVPRGIVEQVMTEQAAGADTGTSGTGASTGTSDTGTSAGTGPSGAGAGPGGLGAGGTPIVAPPTVNTTGVEGAGPTGTGTGTEGPGTTTPGTGGISGGMLGLSSPMPSELVFPELFTLKKDYTVLNNLLSYRPGGLFS